MAVTVDSFQRLYPEFADAPPGLVAGKLTEARVHCPEAIWGDFADEGIGLYVAQSLYDSPFSRHMARVDQGNDRQGVRSDASPYIDRLRRLTQMVASGYRVL